MEIYLLLFAIPFLIFILGLVLAIINFKSKKLTIEVIAWACILIVTLLNIILFFNSNSYGIFSAGISDNQIFAIPIYIALFLLLQYRSDQAKDIQTFRVYYVLKSFCLVQILVTLTSIGLSALYSYQPLGIDKIENRQIISYIFSGTNLIVFSTLFIFIMYRYFKTTTPLLNIKSMFVEGFVIAVIINLFAEIWNIISVYLRFHSFEWFNITYVLTLIFLSLLQAAIGTWIAAYIYINKSDKNSA